MEASSLSHETAALQIHTVLWSDLAPLRQESGRKLNSYWLLFDATRPTESPLMGSQASVTKYVSCSLVAPSFRNAIYFIFYRLRSITLCFQIGRLLCLFFEMELRLSMFCTKMDKYSRLQHIYFLSSSIKNA